MADAAVEQSGAAGSHSDAEVRARLDRARGGGPPRHREKVAAQGKLMPRQRIALLFDEGTDFVEDGLLANNADPELSADGVNVNAAIPIVIGNLCLVVVSANNAEVVYDVHSYRSPRSTILFDLLLQSDQRISCGNLV